MRENNHKPLINEKFIFNYNNIKNINIENNTYRSINNLHPHPLIKNNNPIRIFGKEISQNNKFSENLLEMQKLPKNKEETVGVFFQPVQAFNNKENIQASKIGGPNMMRKVRGKNQSMDENMLRGITGGFKNSNFVSNNNSGINNSIINVFPSIANKDKSQVQPFNFNNKNLSQLNQFSSINNSLNFNINTNSLQSQEVKYVSSIKNSFQNYQNINDTENISGNNNLTAFTNNYNVEEMSKIVSISSITSVIPANKKKIDKNFDNDANVLMEGMYDDKINDENINCLENIDGQNFSFSQNFSLENSHNLIYPHPYLEYLHEIYLNLLNEELEFSAIKTFPYMQNQTEICEKMRLILIDWLRDVTVKFKLRLDTFFLTVNLIDRYLGIRIIKRDKFQLLGLSALFIACKYEEIYYPEIRDFVYICDKAFSKNQILDMELEILVALNFEVIPIFPPRFLEIMAFKLNLSKKENYFCQLMLELFILDYKYAKYLSSIIACSCIYILFKLKKYSSTTCFEFLKEFMPLMSDTGDIINNTSHEEPIKECAQCICYLLDNINNNYYKKVKSKYAKKEYCGVSDFENLGENFGVN